MIKIELTSVLVNDQAKALRYYTEVLGFEKRTEIPGTGWITVASPSAPDVELLLEPTAFAPAKTYQNALYEAGIPATAFAVDDLRSECERLQSRGVLFRTEPTETEGAAIAVLDDRCGNLIQLYQRH